MSQPCYEKYAPRSFDEIIYTSADIPVFMRAYADESLPVQSLLLHGPNGNGKSATANLLASELEQRGWQLLRDEIVDFMRHKDLFAYVSNCIHPAMYGDGTKAVAVFHELDRYGKDLSRLWTLMDDMNGRFVVFATSNDPANLPKAMLSRFQKYEFRPISPQQFAERGQYILSQEGLNLSVTEVEHPSSTQNRASG